MDKITVIWVNTGDAFPETEKIIRDFSKKIPSFLEVKSNVLQFKKNFGHPTDLLPTKHSFANVHTQGLNIPMFVNNIDCCAQNIWFPAMSAACDIGATLIIRGQRNEEEEKSIIRSGDKKEGFEFLFPIEDWKKEQVLSYLKEQGFNYPPHFNFSESSLDCMHCTSCLHANQDRTQFMKEKYPEAYNKNKDIIEQIIKSSEEEFKNMREYIYA